LQANIYEAPFAPNSFDYVYSLGVLQHTPDVKNAFSALPPLVVKGGGLCVDIYEKSVKKLFHPKSWIRPLTKKINKNVLFKVVKKNVPFLLRLSQTIGRVPLVGKIIKKLSQWQIMRIFTH
jgi:ubiquinone/menaquinone biosynthesis C-methylase UbiE